MLDRAKPKGERQDEGGSPTGCDKVQACLAVQTQYKGGPEDNAGATSQRPCRHRSVTPQTQGNAGATGQSRAVSAQPLGPRQRGRDRPMAVQSPLSRGEVCWKPKLSNSRPQDIPAGKKKICSNMVKDSAASIRHSMPLRTSPNFFEVQVKHLARITTSFISEYSVRRSLHNLNQALRSAESCARRICARGT